MCPRKCYKNPKLQHVPLEALYFRVGGLIVPPKENPVCKAAMLDFFPWTHLSRLRAETWQVGAV